MDFPKSECFIVSADIDAFEDTKDKTVQKIKRSPLLICIIIVSLQDNVSLYRQFNFHYCQVRYEKYDVRTGYTHI